MGGFSILTNRKRAVVALVHSVVFLLIAVRQMFAANPAAGILGSVHGIAWHVDSLRNPRRSFLHSFVALTYFPRMAGKILFRILHHQRHIGPCQNCRRRPDVSRRPLHQGDHAGQRGSGRTADRSSSLSCRFPFTTRVRGKKARKHPLTPHKRFSRKQPRFVPMFTGWSSPPPSPSV